MKNLCEYNFANFTKYRKTSPRRIKFLKYLDFLMRNYRNKIYFFLYLQNQILVKNPSTLGIKNIILFLRLWMKKILIAFQPGLLLIHWLQIR